MRLSQFIGTWEGMKVENKFNRLLNILLIILLMAMTYLNIAKDQVVVVKPETLGIDAWVTSENASQSYKEAWGLFFATLLGNVTPSNVIFIKDRIEPYLSPSVYTDVINALHVQVQSIIEDRITLRFEPRSVMYENATNKVFIHGYSFVGSSSKREEKQDVTYEYQITISNYAPTLEYLATYEGRPLTQKALSQARDHD